MGLRTSVIFCLLLTVFGLDVLSQASISVYPQTAYRGQATTFLVSGTNTVFGSTSGCRIYLPGSNPFFADPSPIVQSNSTIIADFNIPLSAPVGTYNFEWQSNFYSWLYTTFTVVDPPANKGVISGNVYRSTSVGCSGQAFANQVIKFSPGPYYAYTDAQGHYSAWLPVGTYTVTLNSIPANHTQTCPASPPSLTINTAGQTVFCPNIHLQQAASVDVSAQLVTNIHRPGFSVTNYVILQNLGPIAANNITVKAYVDPNTGFYSAGQGGTFLNDTITWTVPSLAGNSSQNLYFTLGNPLSSLGWSLCYDVRATTSSNDQNLANNTNSICTTVIGSYDPNDKQVWTQDSVVADGPINPSDSLLRYLIRFQNTGTDTAFNIFIRDTLDPNLDPITLQITSASHNYFYNILNGNEVEFVFPNILLEDSTANEPASHGQIEFTIKRLPNLPLGTEINNSASIYFDFNSPVVTNTVTSKICPPVTLDFSTSMNLLSLNLSNNSTGNLGSILWDFGDGNTSTAFAPSHTYSGPGQYNVCLTVTDTCGSRSMCKLVNASCAAPTAAFAPVANLLAVSFSNQSSSATTWLWDFGDGNTSSLQNPSHTYATPGSYLVCLTASDSCGSNTFCDLVLVSCPAPVSAFSWTGSQLQASFVNQSSGQTGATFQWDFGDGNTSTAANPSHSYTTDGSYLVCLTIVDPCGTSTFCDTVTVLCLAPTAAFGFQANGNQVQFSDQSTGNVVSWFWDFGDGNTSTLASPMHSYGSFGTYTACLLATNDCGATDTTCQTFSLVGIEDGPFRSVVLYPNPNDGRFSLEAEFMETGNLAAHVRDLTGRTLYQADWGEVRGAFRRNMEMDLPAGTYFLQLELNGRRLNRMFSIR